MEKTELLKLGFVHRYKPALKKIDTQNLHYDLLISVGNLISIGLTLPEAKNEWKLDYIRFEGDQSLQLIKQYLTNYSLIEVINFAKRFPIQTF